MNMEARVRRAAKLAGCAFAMAGWVLVAACGGDDGKSSGGSGATKGDAKLAADAKSKLMQCKLYDPKGSSADTTIEDESDRCEAKCVAAASCSDLKDLTCSDTPSSKNAAIACLVACTTTPSDGYACSDGTKIAHVALCDGFEDCDDGKDEDGCKTYTCKNGEELDYADAQCDGSEDCEDGSDESGCANLCG